MATQNMTIQQRLFLLNELIGSVVGALRKKYLKQVPPLFLEPSDGYGGPPKLDQPYNGSPFYFEGRQIGAFAEFSKSHFLAVRSGNDSVLDKKVCLSVENFAKEYAEKKLHVPSREWYEKAIDTEDYVLEVEYEDCMTQPRTKVLWNGQEKQLKKERAALAKKFERERAKLVEVFSEARADVLAVNGILRGAARDLALVDNHAAKDMLLELEKDCLKAIK